MFVDHLRRESKNEKILGAVGDHLTGQSISSHPAMEFEMQARLESALSSIPELRRKVFELHRIEGYSYREIARILSISVKAADNNLTKALRHLRKVFLFHRRISYRRSGCYGQKRARVRQWSMDPAHQHKWTSAEPFILYEWSNLFQGIGYCNDFISVLQSRDFSKLGLPVPQTQMIAETRLMRAMYYYWAMDIFGNVPVSTVIGEASSPAL